MKKSARSSEKNTNAKKITKDKLNKVSGGRTGEYMDERERKQNEIKINPPAKEI